MKKITRLSIICFVVFMFSATFQGCKKQESTLDQEPVVKKSTEIDTSFSEPEPLRNIDTSDEVTFSEAELEAEFRRKVEDNMKTVYFGFNSYNLSEDAISRVKKAASFLLDHPNLRVLLEGHCDERGSEEYNMGLGEKRAIAVKHYFIDYGVNSLQLETTSWGEERLNMSGCVDESCHGKNRRAEFKVLSK